MCGISGIIDLQGQKIDFETIKLMTDSIIHRGPDGEGYWRKKNVSFGHRRLKIIDLSERGSQPFVSKDRKHILTYNGEIYNYLNLKKILITKGYKFFSKTDTEVVLYSLMEWGVDALKKFNGMFALAYFNCKTNEMILARDRYGIKPLYYNKDNYFFRFGSEQKVILADKNFLPQLDKEALYEYFTFQNIFTNKTFLKNVNHVPPGSYIKFELYKQKLEIVQYWDYLFKEDNRKEREKDKIEELDFLFNRAVKRQMVSDVEIGAYLSGGLDSGSITSVASKVNQNLKSFTCGFDLNSVGSLELGFDERSAAEKISSFLGTEHYQVVLKSGDMENSLSKIVYHLETPRIGQCYPNFYISKLASKFNKVVLSGVGGDELFGGYPWRYHSAENHKNFDKFCESYYKSWQRLVNNKTLNKLFRPIHKDIKHVWTFDIFKNIISKHQIEKKNHKNFLNHSFYLEAKTFLSGLFTVEDKISMAHGLETRVPFMDNDLVNFAMNCSINFKVKNFKKIKKIDENIKQNKKLYFYSKTNEGKYLLRKVLKKYLPDKIFQEKKKGFSGPDQTWFRKQSYDWLIKQIESKNFILAKLLDKKVIYKLIKEHYAGKTNKRLFIWSILYVNEYLRQLKIL
ncbi:asparagine synthase (glutamine-hydrolyzing) [Candidatus Pelagibacter sp.]|nr:asparagine synthase (glutamine-hydrolyzing) [Candidatus Pelagibacter sp.]